MLAHQRDPEEDVSPAFYQGKDPNIFLPVKLLLSDEGLECFARRMLPYALAAAIGTGAGAAVMNLIQPDTTDRDTQYQLELVE